MKLRINGEEHELPEGWSVQDLLGARSLQAARVAVERNGQVVKRATYAATRLHEGDEVEIVSFFGGG